MSEGEAARIADVLVEALGDQTLRHVEAYVQHLEREHDVCRLAHWQLVAEVIRRKFPFSRVNGASRKAGRAQVLTMR